jgi:hypothetical protein
MPPAIAEAQVMHGRGAPSRLRAEGDCHQCCVEEGATIEVMRPCSGEGGPTSSPSWSWREVDLRRSGGRSP